MESGLEPAWQGSDQWVEESTLADASSSEIGINDDMMSSPLRTPTHV